VLHFVLTLTAVQLKEKDAPAWASKALTPGGAKARDNGLRPSWCKASLASAAIEVKRRSVKHLQAILTVKGNGGSRSSQSSLQKPNSFTP